MKATPKRPEKSRLFQLRLMSREPVELLDTDRFMATWPEAKRRLREQVHRTSYMVDGPNREVWWSLEGFSVKAGKWSTIVQGKARLKDDAKPL